MVGRVRKRRAVWTDWMAVDEHTAANGSDRFDLFFQAEGGAKGCYRQRLRSTPLLPPYMRS